MVLIFLFSCNISLTGTNTMLTVVCWMSS